MAKPINENKIVIFSGAGISAESGLQTFRDSDGLWNNYSIEDVATPKGWEKNPQLVLDFYNQRRREAAKAQPNLAHCALVDLEKKYEVIIITQNVDDLHERAGSNQVLHLHGQLCQARSCATGQVYHIGSDDITLESRCDQGAQLRPNIVWFGEQVENMNLASEHIKTAARILVVGTSLSVFPAAGLLKKARNRAEKIIVSLDIDSRPYGYRWLRGKATENVPHVINLWVENKRIFPK